jgi:hypothetical protein
MVACKLNLLIAMSYLLFSCMYVLLLYPDLLLILGFLMLDMMIKIL